MNLRQRFTLNDDMAAAVARSFSHGLLDAQPSIDAPPVLTSAPIRAEITEICRTAWPVPVARCCLMVATYCIEPIKARLARDAWLVFGWLSDPAKPGATIWKMDAEVLCKALKMGLSTGYVDIGDFHTWIMLDSGEVIDPVVYGTLAEVSPQFKRGAGVTNMLSKQGQPYTVKKGLPFLRYHPSAIARSVLREDSSNEVR